MDECEHAVVERAQRKYEALSSLPRSCREYCLAVSEEMLARQAAVSIRVPPTASRSGSLYEPAPGIGPEVWSNG